MHITPERLAIPYPRGFLRGVLRLPLLLYRLGLGDMLNAVHILILTTRGRSSGKPRAIPVEYRRHGSKIYVISGWGARPQWFQNMRSEPVVTVQMGHRLSAARGSVVTDPAEALRALYLFRRTAPARYDAVLGMLIEATVNARTLPDVSGQFTVVRLDLLDDLPPLPGLTVNLTWVWPVALITLMTSLALVMLARLRRVTKRL